MRPVLLVLALVTVGCDGNKIPPEVSARTFLTQLGMHYEGVSCTGVDTDMDGYVTCTVNLGDGKLTSLQCAALNGYAAGCKQTAAWKAPVQP